MKWYKRRAIEELMQNGGRIVDMPHVGPMTREQAEKLVLRVSDKAIRQSLGDESLWTRIRKWFYLHKDEILFVIKVIITLALMFLEAETVEDWTVYGYDRGG